MAENDIAEKSMTLVGHLTELRRCIIKSLIVWFLGAVVFGCFTEKAFWYLTEPFGVKELVYIAPAEGFLAYFRLAVLGGLVLASPMIIFQLLRFVLPGLYGREREVIFGLFPAAVLLMLLGIAFGYFILLPWTMHYLIGFGTGRLVPMLSVQKYIGFVTSTLLLMGGVFELPLLIVGLTRLGMLTPRFLRAHRKYAILLAVTLGAILTPPDVISQVLLAGPLILLYEVSIWLSYFVWKKRERQKESLLKHV